MATRKDFVVLAKIAALIEMSEENEALNELVAYCERSNPNFSFTKFRKEVDRVKYEMGGDVSDEHEEREHAKKRRK